MHKVLRYSIYLSILLFYNVTTLYTSVVHNHHFNWTDEETCSAYIISISQNSDTFPFSPNQNLKNPKVSILDITTYEAISEIEFLSNYSERAPPSFI